MTGNPDRSLTIDTHHHILPDFFWQETENAHAPSEDWRRFGGPKEASISFMDDAGIDVAVVSVSTPGVHVGDDARARALARRCNEFAAQLVQSRPDRFGSFAALPLPDVDGALEELRYALDVLRLDGVLLFSNVQGIYLGDARLEPVFTELERRAAIVFVHPNPSPDPVAHRLGLPDSLIDFTADTTRAVAQMLYSNRFARTPNVKYIFLARRRNHPLPGRPVSHRRRNARHPGSRQARTAADMFRGLYWDTALAFGDPVLRMLRSVVGLRQVMCGSDYPYFRRDLAVGCIAALRTHRGVGRFRTGGGSGCERAEALSSFRRSASGLIV